MAERNFIVGFSLHGLCPISPVLELLSLVSFWAFQASEPSRLGGTYTLPSNHTHFFTYSDHLFLTANKLGNVRNRDGE